ncbi:MAG: methyltransferase [Chlamydiales bacterium]|jgi:ubiquinone/menaquinone biosynthesis C-methylase UbiE|nr:methyltransferase [Chlamydiales bacterium]
MVVTWDYSKLAAYYLKRPSYSSEALNKMYELVRLRANLAVCDIGAGVGNLSKELNKQGAMVYAVEPNNNMRAIGMKETAGNPYILWLAAPAENTSVQDNSVDLVTFGSSFNVVNKTQALTEVHRILRPQGWMVCMWNHRDLTDPIQAKIEEIIHKYVKDYSYGDRRQDQTEFLKGTGMFSQIHKVEGPTVHTQTIDDVIEAWKSHGTLARQAGDKFELIIKEISSFLKNLQFSEIKVPYTTRMWVCQIIKSI